MEDSTRVLEYKCPCCNAGLSFGGSQKLTCEYCGNSFELETVKAFQASEQTISEDSIQWDETGAAEWDPEEQDSLRAFQCPSCGGEILAEETTAATFCPYCGNPSILPTRLAGGLRPDALIPFKTTKQDAKDAFLRLCKGKVLLPKEFTRRQQVEKITGLYVPFWLYDCGAAFSGSYRATRIHCWADHDYEYTRTDHYLLERSAEADFVGIPMDGSSKMDDVFMESIEPFDYKELTGFDTAYLSGYLADKYDVPSEDGEGRIRQRVDRSIGDALQTTFLGYASVVPASRQLQVEHSRARYVMLPVWILNTRYKGKLYTFAMNGQTGKMTGTFPISAGRAAAWFTGIFGGVALLATLVQFLL